MKKSVIENIFFSACDDCKDKTIEQMQALKKPMNSKENMLYSEYKLYGTSEIHNKNMEVSNEKRYIK